MHELAAVFELPHSLDAPWRARRTTAETLMGWGFTDRSWRDAAVLVVSELVSLVMGRDGDAMALELRLRDGRLRATVTHVFTSRPGPGEPVEDSIAKKLIEAFADRWGVEPIAPPGNGARRGEAAWAVLSEAFA